MPLYDYRCTECGRLVEDVLQSASDPPPAVDEPCKAPTACGGPCDLERVLAPLTPHIMEAGRGGWTAVPGTPLVTRRHGRGDKPTGS